MVDTASITVPGEASPFYEGRCWVRAVTPSGQLEYIDGGTPERRRIDFPHDVDAPAGCVIRVTASDDTSLLDLKFRVISRSAQSYVLYREHWCEVVA